MGGSTNLVDQEDRRFIVVTLLRLPGKAAEEVGIIESSIVIAPVRHVLHCACSGYCGLKSYGLGDEPVGHVSAITVATHSEVLGISDSIFHQGVHSFQNILARARDNLRNNLHQESVAVATGSPVIGFKDQPSLTSGQSIPLIPVRLEVIAIGSGRPAVNEHERRQVFRFEFSRRVDQHAFNRRAIIGRPSVRLPLWQIALGK